jgi:Flp pilus assembly pilin Flp
MTPRRSARPTLIADTRGAGFVEYLVLVAAIALLAIASIRMFGFEVDRTVRCETYKVAKLKTHCPKPESRAINVARIE